MDRMIYTAMNGAMRIAEHHAVLSNNMANASTPGFREQIALYRSVPVNDGVSLPTRVATVAATPGSKFQMGPIQMTDRSLDVAISGNDGWFVVQTPQGEAYTRAGGFYVGLNGLLQTERAEPVLSVQNVPIEVPEMAEITIASDGTITALGAGDPPNNLLNLGQLKLVNPPLATLVRGDDGLFRRESVNGQPLLPLPNDPGLRVMAGALEGSNANPVAAMVGVIENARLYEMEMQVIAASKKNADHANSILDITA